MEIGIIRCILGRNTKLSSSLSSRLNKQHLSLLSNTSLQHRPNRLLLQQNHICTLHHHYFCQHHQYAVTKAQKSCLNMSTSSFPVTANLRAKLTEAFEPSHLEVINESYMHNV